MRCELVSVCLLLLASLSHLRRRALGRVGPDRTGPLFKSFVEVQLVRAERTREILAAILVPYPLSSMRFALRCSQRKLLTQH